MTASPLVGPRPAPDLHVMTFNIRRRMAHFGNRNPDLWSRRAPAMRRLLKIERPAILGVQEGMPDQTEYLAASLPGYKWVGQGRDADRGGERVPLFYDSRRLHLESWNQLWLSDTPDEPGSKSWGNRIPRIAVNALLTDLETGLLLRVINTHLDHKSQVSRVQAARMLGELVAASAEPTILTGDFNTAVHTEPFRELTRTLDDTWDVAAKRLTGEWGTFPNYRAPKLDRKRIDWILASPGISVSQAAVNSHRPGGRAPSDHLPVSAVIRVAA